MQNSITIRTKILILILAFFTMPLIIYTMVVFKWLFHVEFNLFPYDEQIWFFLLALSLFYFPFVSIAKGQTNSPKKVALGVFIMYVMSMNVDFSISAVDWGKLLVTTLLSVSAALLVYRISTLIKLQSKGVENIPKVKTHSILKSSSEMNDEYENQITELEKRNSYLWERLDQCRKALESYIRRDYNEYLRVNYSCPICNEEFTELTQIISHDKNCMGHDLKVIRTI